MQSRQTNTLIIIAALLCANANSVSAQTATDKRATASAKDKKSLAISTIPGLVSAPHPVNTTKSGAAANPATYSKKAASTYPRSHFDRGLYFKQRGDLNAALVEFLKASQENPQQVRAFYEQALIFRQRGYVKLAQSSLEQALAVKNNYQEARVLLATIQLEHGDLGGAVQELTRSLGLDKSPSSKAALNALTDSPKLPPEQPADPLSSLSRTVGEAVAQAPLVLQSLHKAITNPPKSEAPASTQSPGKSEASQGDGGFTLRPYPAVEKKAKSSSPPQTVLHWSADSTPPGSPDGDEKTKKDANAQLQSEVPRPSRFRFFWHAQKEKQEKGDDDSGKNKHAKAEQKSDDDSASAPSGSQSKERKKKADKEEQPLAQTPKRKARGWFMKFINHNEDEADSSEHSDAKSAYDDRTASAPARSDQPGQPSAKTRANQETRSKKSDPEEEDLKENDRIASAEANTKTHKALKFQVAEASEAPSKDAPSPKDDEPRAEARPSSDQSFRAPGLPSKEQGLLASVVTESLQPQAPAAPAVPDDDWTVRLRYLAQNGTSTLKDGEAFMFSEDTGEATMFLSDGQTIRRQISPPRDAQEVVRQRRPELLFPQDLLYNLSLLGKLMPQPQKQDSQTQTENAAASGAQTDNQPASNFNVDDLMGHSDGFWGWLKHAFKF